LWRLQNGEPYWRDEQPSDEIKAYVESQLEKAGWKVDMVLTHTIPKNYMNRIPKHAFLQGISQDSIDQSTEEWLQSLEERLDYRKWYCGHFHVSEKLTERMEMLFLEYVDISKEDIYETGDHWNGSHGMQLCKDDTGSAAVGD